MSWGLVFFVYFSQYNHFQIVKSQVDQKKGSRQNDLRPIIPRPFKMIVLLGIIFYYGDVVVFNQVFILMHYHLIIDSIILLEVRWMGALSLQSRVSMLHDQQKVYSRCIQSDLVALRRRIIVKKDHCERGSLSPEGSVSRVDRNIANCGSLQNQLTDHYAIAPCSMIFRVRCLLKGLFQKKDH